MILIGLGSSLPFSGKSPRFLVEAAITVLGRLFVIRRVSSLYESPAWPNPADPPFVNAVVLAETTLSPDGVLSVLHAIEAGFGRRRSAPNAPRTLDLDLLDQGGRALVPDRQSDPHLPHPRLAERDFVLLPLAEIAPDWRSPATGACISDLIAALPMRQARRLIS